MNFIFNRYSALSWFIKSYLIILGIAILSLGLAISVPPRPFGIPITYLPCILIVSYFLCFPKIPKIIKKELSTFMLFWLFSVFTNIGNISNIKTFVLFSIMYLVYIIIFIHGIKVTKTTIIKLISSYIWIIFFASLISLICYFFGLLKDPNIMSLFSINRNNFVFLVCIATMIQFFLTISKPTIKNTCFISIFLLTIIFLISRTAYIAVIGSIFLFFKSSLTSHVILDKTFKKRLKKVIFFSVVLISMTIAISPTFQSRITSASEIIQILGTKQLNNSQLGGRRQLLMLAHLNLFFQHPLTGVGIGQSNNKLNKSSLGTSIGSSHNTQIRILAENGIIGFILLSIFYWMIFKKLRKNYQFDEYSLGFYYGYINLLILSFGNEYFLTNPMIWVFISLGYSYSLNVSYEKNTHH